MGGQDERDGAAKVLRNLLNAVAEGTLQAESPAERTIVRRWEGAAIALEKVDEPSQND